IEEHRRAQRPRTKSHRHCGSRICTRSYISFGRKPEPPRPPSREPSPSTRLGCASYATPSVRDGADEPRLQLTNESTLASILCLAHHANAAFPTAFFVNFSELR